MKNIVIEKGEFAEGMEWEICFDFHEMGYSIDADNSCKHVKDGVVRAVVYARNEGGNNCTAVCLDCILDAIKENGL